MSLIVGLGVVFVILYFIGCVMRGLAIGNLASNKMPSHICFNQTGYPRCQICGKVLPHQCYGDKYCVVCGKKIK